jgi:predicted alpha/beta-fold hydrolase
MTEVDILGYSLGGAHAAVVKWLDASQHELDIRRAVMINPPVSLFDSMERLDRLFASSIGEGDGGFDQLYRRVYVRLANYYRATDQVPGRGYQPDGSCRRRARTDADFSAAIALTRSALPS